MSMNITQAWACLEQVKDPEIPVVSVIDMGIVRNVHQQGSKLTVTITPTYSGCPAMKMIEDTIVATLAANGADEVEVDTVLSPPWTTDWMSEVGKRKLKEYGIAPPKPSGGKTPSPFDDQQAHVPCPHCDSHHTEPRSQFGSTACKALYYCNGCHQPFEYFKCI